MKTKCQKLRKKKKPDNGAVYDTPRYASVKAVPRAAVSYNEKEKFVKSYNVFLGLGAVGRSLSKSPLRDFVEDRWTSPDYAAAAAAPWTEVVASLDSGMPLIAPPYWILRGQSTLSNCVLC